MCKICVQIFISQLQTKQNMYENVCKQQQHSIACIIFKFTKCVLVFANSIRGADSERVSHSLTNNYTLNACVLNFLLNRALCSFILPFSFGTNKKIYFPICDLPEC